MRSFLKIRSSWPVLLFTIISTTGCAAFPGGQAKQTQETASHEDLATMDLARAELCEIRGDLEEAAEYCHGIIATDPQRVAAHHRLAIIEAKQEQFDQSFDSFTRALRLAPNDPKLLSDLGYALYLGDRLDMAEKALQKAIQLDPTLTVAKDHLALVLEQSGSVEENIDPQQVVDAENNGVSAPETDRMQISKVDRIEQVDDMPDLEVAEIVSDVNELVIEKVVSKIEVQAAVPQVLKEQVNGEDRVVSVQYVEDADMLEPVSRLSDAGVVEGDASELSRAADPAIYYRSVDERTSESNANEESAVQHATHLKPLGKRRGSPLSDLSEAMTLLEGRRSRGSNAISKQPPAEAVKLSEPHDVPQIIRLDSKSRVTLPEDRSTLNIVAP